MMEGELIIKRHPKLTRFQLQFLKETILFINYLLKISPIAGASFFIYSRRKKIGEFFKDMDLNQICWRSYKQAAVIFGGIFLLFYTFTFWATILCLLIMGYGIRKLSGTIKIKAIRH